MSVAFSRRTIFVALGGLASASIIGFRFFSTPINNFFGFNTSAQMSQNHWSVIAILVNHILPRTPTSPSGIDAGVLTYLQYALSGNIKGWRPSLKIIESKKSVPIPPGYSHLTAHYIRAAERLDQLSKEQFNQSFVQIPHVDQEKIVAKFASGASADVGYNVKGAPSLSKATDKSLFELVRRHSLEGFFSDPSNGGNTNYIAWESVKHTCHVNYPKDQSQCPKPDMHSHP